ncbi:RNA polymerase sigma-70 factor, ECF subfamily [Duganella sp. CF458]|uniref:RNA polymerase sigma-70 factor n=1 Tax=Duganella sp. CF458 TaxID=1884368 RepID=UPI0008E7D50E|nr:RNA polymerase sigma-70 factor [Duganella sp. CF458]SFF92940.1 RNA polymerase sigma-70 factor, ECF subfamily [Duganella sp. CF458]
MNDPIVFAAHRARLFAIAYRMLGVRADAEDVLQDAWIRWQGADTSGVQSAEAWLVTVVTRLSIDRLRAAIAEREAYEGLWLPEPLVAVDQETPEAQAERASDLSLAYMWLLQRLGPEERAAFLLRQVFDYDYDEVAQQLGKSEAACRQMVSRAGERVQQGQSRFDIPADTHRQLLQRFVDASASGDKAAVRALLAHDLELVGDGGGKVKSFGIVITDPDKIAALYAGMHKLGAIAYRAAMVNGEPGLLRFVDGQLESAQGFATDGQRITGIYVVRNPDKLAHIYH